MQWQKELYHHEELPPPFIWDVMKVTLSTEPYEVRQSLLNFTENPPERVWEQVLNTMKKGEETPKQPILHHIRRTALSYAAAIVGIGLFISILVFMMNNKSNEVGVQDLAAGLNFQDSPKTEDVQKDTGTKELIQKEKMLQELPATSEDGLAENITSVPPIAEKKQIVQSVESETKSEPHTPENKARSKSNITTATGFTNDQKVSYADGNYILVLNADGGLDRVSYKLSGMVKSLHAKEHTGKSANAESRHWNKVLMAWKEKMGQSDFIPAGSNFFDIAEMAEMLNSEQ